MGIIIMLLSAPPIMVEWFDIPLLFNKYTPHLQFAVMQGRRLFSSVFAITERKDMGLYEVPLSVAIGHGLLR